MQFIRNSFLIISHYFSSSLILNASSDTEILNLAPLPYSPFSQILISVIPKISRERKSPKPVFFPKPTPEDYLFLF